MKYLTVIIISLMLAACGSGETPEVRINSVAHSGDGCPMGTAGIILAEDKRSLSVTFDGNYEAIAGVGSGENGGADVAVHRIACDIAVSLHIPAGYQAFLIGADYRGGVSLPVGAEAEFNREYFFAGDRSSVLTQNWGNEFEDPSFVISDDLYAEADGGSICGQDIIFRSNTSLYVTAPVDGDTALVQMDSFDYIHQQHRGSFIYEFAYARCS